MTSCFGRGGSHAPEVTVLPFRGGAAGAYSIIHDDACEWSSFGLPRHAVPALNERGLTAAFAVVGSVCEERGLSGWLAGLAGAGHEIANHSWTHTALVACDAYANRERNCSERRPDYAAEIDRTRNWLRDAAGVSVESFVFPFDAFDDFAIAYLADNGYLTTRAGGLGFNDPDDIDPLRLAFDEYGPGLSIYAEMVRGGEVENILDRYVDDAMANGSWAVRGLHGIDDDSWEPVSSGAYEKHLDYVKSLVDERRLWMANPTTVARYLVSRAKCGTPTLSGSVLEFENPEPECDVYRSKLTVRVDGIRDAAGLAAAQDGRDLAIRASGDGTAIIEDVDPTKPVELNFGAGPNDGDADED
jgi:peptidoglycan/xylan/chitin deacetylase (PgdA/CDA1 family)